MGNRCDASFYWTILGLFMLLWGTSGSASLLKERSRGTSFQLGDLTQGFPHSAPVYRTHGDKRIIQGVAESSSLGYDSKEADILKSIILHLIKYPRRLNRAEAKSENYNLRANYIPRLGRKRSSGKK
ncbi:uncharacterized protein TNIN_162791 [Trichonephila inaurata madagascariensis]|uniref:Uncharacterized protein n=1 Tax=Trichonephila inaurata madagascariensis TaxID=2747483 RepID=A0A8X6YD25_9ARAC|nr:uncharacterized protein TNIN_162791 [Trichonephila inaurata madagascariensis]